MKPLRSRLVFVDDRAHWLRSMGRVFEASASRVYLYTNPLEALEQIPLRRPDAVVLASRMAHASGAQLARALRRRLGSACPRLVLLIEADEHPSEADRALFAEVHVKPVSAETLCEILGHAARSARLERLGSLRVERAAG
ncbi:MAG: response regulator [Sandaracinaceae bacterium]